MAFLHALAHVPVPERALRVHEVELVVSAGECLRDGRGIGDHAASTHCFGQIAARNRSCWMAVVAALEDGGAPIHRLHGALRVIAATAEVDAGSWHQVGLEFCDVNVQCAAVAQRRSERRDDLRQQSVEVGVSWLLNVRIPPADVLQSLVIVNDSHVRVLKEGVHAPDRVMRPHLRSSALRACPHSE